MSFPRTASATAKYLSFLLVLMSLDFSSSRLPAQAASVPVAAGQQWVTIPYSPLNGKGGFAGQPVVLFTLNDSLQVPFLVDTGAVFTFLSEDAAKKLSLPLIPAVRENGEALILLGQRRSATNVSMRAGARTGGFNLRKHTVIVFDRKTFAISSHLFDGVLGINELNPLALMMDPQAHALTVWYPGGLKPWQIEKLGFSHAYVLPITQNKDTGFWYVKAHLTSGSVSDDEDLMLDTGSSHTSISDRVAQRLALRPTGVTSSKDVYSRSLLTTAAVEKVQIGDLTLLSLPVDTRATTMKEPAVLGMNVLSGYRVLMDFPGGKVYLQPDLSTIPAITIGPAPAPPAK